MYLWTIAGVIVISARYSTKITKLFGNRAVPILCTLFLFSSTKLLKTILDSLTPARLIEVSRNHNTACKTVWSLDGSFCYFEDLHILVFLAAAFFFIFLWLLYTLLLCLMQWIQRKSHLRMFKWVPRLTPVYDAYSAPLKDKHHYWFGLLLVTRCMLLIIYIATYTICPSVNDVLLLVTTAVLLMYGNYYRVYKSKYVQFSENFFFLQIVIIGAVSLYVDEEKKIILIYVVRASIILVLLALCVLVVWNSVMFAKTCYLKQQKKSSRDYEHESSESEACLIRRGDIQSRNVRYRDSIFDTTESELGLR